MCVVVGVLSCGVLYILGGKWEEILKIGWRAIIKINIFIEIYMRSRFGEI